MQEVKGLVSVVVPVYNGERYLKETITSIKQQTYTEWEIIIVNDGSTDKTATIIESESGSKIRSVFQENSGVSVARNNGLQNSNGEYVVFFDADDLMTPEFIELRLRAVQINKDIGFTGGMVETFPEKSGIKRAAAENPEKEILFFDPLYVTVPSNYLVKRQILIDNNIRFNTALNSTADRFFILQLSRVTKGISIESEKGRLLYRVNEQSMSHKVGSSLILDNEQFYAELKNHDIVPSRHRAKFKTVYFYSLAGGFFKINYFRKFIIYLTKSFFASPLSFIRITGRRIYN